MSDQDETRKPGPDQEGEEKKEDTPSEAPSEAEPSSAETRKEEAERIMEEVKSSADLEIEGQAKDGSPRLKMSNDLLQALADAEEAVVKGREKKEAPPGEEAAPEGEQEGTEEEVEVDVDFDPNAVDEGEEKPAPIPEGPSPKEMELKMQVLDYRQQLREAEQNLEKKGKEFKQNAEQAKMLKNQFDSYKARMQKEKADQFNYGLEPLIKELLPVLDHLELAVKHAPDNEESKGLKQGVELTLKQFLAVFGKFGVEPIDPSEALFDPQFHQAMSTVENNDLPSGTVVQVHQKGYTLKDRLVRPAMVVVSKNTAAKEEAKPEAAEGTDQEGGEENPVETGPPSGQEQGTVPDQGEEQ